MQHQKSQTWINQHKPQENTYNHRKQPYSAYFRNSNKPSSGKKYVSLLKSQLFDGLKKYEWRLTTQFPVIKILSYKIMQTNQYDYLLQIQTQQISCLLDGLRQLSLNKGLYLLKESMIGYERLYTKYGAFKINQKMICINKQNKCKIWLNMQFEKNDFQTLTMNQMQFIESIWRIFKQKLIINKLSQEFCKLINQYHTFSAIVRFIDQFAKNNKLIIPNYFAKFQIHPVEKQKMFNPNLTMSRAPKFLQRRRNSSKEKHESIERLKEGGIKLSKDKTAFTPTFLQSKKQIPPLQMSPQLLKTLKISGQTRVDMKSSNNTNKMIRQTNQSGEICSAPNIFRSQSQIQQNYPIELNKSQGCFQFKPRQPKIKRTRSTINQHICFTPQPQKNSRNYDYNSGNSSNIGNRWKMDSFLNNQIDSSQIIKQEDVYIYQANKIEDQLDNLFEKNNWQNKIEGLFSKQNVLKTSFQEGDEPTWRKDENSRELSLLNSIKVSLFESKIMQ